MAKKKAEHSIPPPEEKTVSDRIVHRIPVTLIDPSPRARPVEDGETLAALMESLSVLGLQQPISVRAIGDRYVVVDGHRRLEAWVALGFSEIDCFIEETTDETVIRMLEITANLHREELPQLERAKLIAEWVELVKESVSRQVDAKPQGGRPQGGIRDAARQLGFSESDVRRSLKMNSLCQDAQEMAYISGLIDNQAALLEAAELPKGEQAAFLYERAKSEAKKKQENLGSWYYKVQEKEYASLDKALKRLDRDWKKVGEALKKASPEVMKRIRHEHSLLHKALLFPQKQDADESDDLLDVSDNEAPADVVIVQ